MQYSTVRCGPAGRLRRAAYSSSKAALGGLFRAEDAAHQARQFQVVARRVRMRDHHVRHEFGQQVHGRLLVLVDVDHHVGGRQLADLLDVHVLGAAHLGNVGHRVVRVDAEAGAPDDPARQAQLAQQFGDRGHQADDAGVRGRLVALPERVSQKCR
jgi:hypothetical protein